MDEPTDIELNEKLSHQMVTELQRAVDALMAGDKSPMLAFMSNDTQKSAGTFPDVWRQAAAHLMGCAPTRISERSRQTAKELIVTLMFQEGGALTPRLAMKLVELGRATSAPAESVGAKEGTPTSLSLHRFEVLARALRPTSRPTTTDPDPMQPVQPMQPLQALLHLSTNQRALGKLAGILLDTGDCTHRRFDRPYFDGNGAFSVLSQQVLLDRVRYGFSIRSGISQGGWEQGDLESLIDIVEDVAEALVGDKRRITWQDNVSDDLEG